MISHDIQCIQRGQLPSPYAHPLCTARERRCTCAGLAGRNALGVVAAGAEAHVAGADALAVATTHAAGLRALVVVATCGAADVLFATADAVATAHATTI